eukprot:scaffold33548_cov130-Skeletonema_dohrnii-CCMP3373.AAC.4
MVFSDSARAVRHFAIDQDTYPSLLLMEFALIMTVALLSRDGARHRKQGVKHAPLLCYIHMAFIREKNVIHTCFRLVCNSAGTSLALALSVCWNKDGLHDLIRINVNAPIHFIGVGGCLAGAELSHVNVTPEPETEQLSGIMNEQDQEATPNRIDSELSADVAGMMKRIDETLKEQQDQDQHIISSANAKHASYHKHPSETHRMGEMKNNPYQPSENVHSFFCEACLRKSGSCNCKNTSNLLSNSPSKAIEDSEAVATVTVSSMQDHDLFAAAVDKTTVTTPDDIRLDSIENSVKPAGEIDQVVNANVKIDKQHKKKKEDTNTIVIGVEEEGNENSQALKSQRYAFAIAALLLLFVSILIGLLFAFARPRRTS